MTALASIRRQLLHLEQRLNAHLRHKSSETLAHRAVATANRPSPRHLILGERGEDAAFTYLCELGYTVVARRWHSSRRSGDLDLIAWHDATLVFVEVKTRTHRDISPAESKVDSDKQRILRQLAAAYLAQFPERHRDNIPIRFDVISVYLLSTGAQFDYFPNAFARFD
ncbi:MAG: YraN family protein [Acidobacteriota bacterium]